LVSCIGAPYTRSPTRKMGKHGIEQWHVIPTRTDVEDIGAPAVPGAHFFHQAAARKRPPAPPLPPQRS
jgi:hypothetical protein